MPVKKHPKIRRALRLPFHGRAGANAVRRSTAAPRPGEQPVVFLRVQVIGCTGLVAKDRNGFSDPFVVTSLLRTRHQTPVAKKTLNPVFLPKDATWDFPIYLSVADKLGVLELVVWDKDVLRKEYIGEIGIPVEEWFGGRDKAWGASGNIAFSMPIVSSRPGSPAQGTVQLRLGFVAPPLKTSAPNQATVDFDAVYLNLVKTGRKSLVSAPPTEGVGTLRSHLSHPDFLDDGGLSSASSSGTESDDEDLDDIDSEDDESYELVEDTNSLRRSPDPSYTAETVPPSVSRLQALYGPPPDIGVTPGTPVSELLGVKTPTGPSPLTTPTPSSSGTAVPSAPFALPANGPEKSPVDKKPKPSFIALPLPTKFMKSRSRPTTPKEVTHKESNDKDAGKKKRFRKSWNGAATITPLEEVGGASTPTGVKGKEKEVVKDQKSKPRRRPKPQRAFSLGADAGAASHEDDIVGIVMLEIEGAVDLPRLRNMTRTSFDMDPFVVISFGKKVFRTRVIRHTLNPVWDEKLLFHVRRYELGYEVGFVVLLELLLTCPQVRLTVLDWDKLTSNDYIGEAAFTVGDLLADAPQPLPPSPEEEGEGAVPVLGSSPTDADMAVRKRGTRIPLYAADESGDHPMKEFKRKLEIRADGGKEPVWESKHSPVITFRAKYQPYSLLRQRFWRQYLKQYDTDDTATLSHVEITSMLDSLGSTLTAGTVDSFFTRFGKDPHRDDLTVEEVIRCLETEVLRPNNERRRIDEDVSGGTGTGTSLSASPSPAGASGELRLAELDFAGPSLEVDFITGEPKGYVTEPAEMVLLPAGDSIQAGHARLPTSESSSDGDLEEESSGSPSATPASPPSNSLSPPVPTKKNRFRRPRYRKTQTSSIATPSQVVSSGASSGDESFERVINIKNCPLCHRPRLNSKAEVDIITHIAVCASQDWNILDRIVVSNFVTAHQAQRKFLTNIFSKISSGDYRLGANSANIIVQNRLTGQLEEEKMQVYVRLGIRLLYKGMKSRMEGGRARRLLKSLSIKQGLKYDSPESARDIPAFVEFHNLKVSEIRDPLSSFKTFNQFFYRKLKPDARPVDQPDDPYRLVSAADCRFMAFESVSEATRLWIKGREFTVARLLGDAYKHEADRFTGGALAIFRLAPQDYHRFHSPVDGTIGNMTYIAGEYYTVNPQAIRTALDVYGENARKIVPIDSPQFGRVMAVCVGAMMVGSILTTVKEGDTVKRGQEFGYFAFGGSTIVLLFEKDALEWDEDLLVNGRASLETLVRVGMGIGTGTRRPKRVGN
ncbi:phosphatidylserine decarboxylase-domain-containing protein [Roridomyces roridus]|uniref:Phosphatidylserine decarboxylase proenzyme 2 n=1 Tax=Roridomyces roridus TaxID=1738132 RepID=A0AAD7BZJ4_9AGAR|nr:phosphatidylserine decarboxylase-domain-containing protein [Roridomyces roridus]